MYKTHEELGITQWEHTRLIEFIDDAKNMRHTKPDDKPEAGALQFNMDFTAVEKGKFECGSVACIGGHIFLKENNVDFNNISEAQAQRTNDYVDSNRSKALARLFYPPADVNYQEVTPKIAADVVNNFLKTGEIDWSDAPLHDYDDED